MSCCLLSIVFDQMLCWTQGRLVHFILEVMKWANHPRSPFPLTSHDKEMVLVSYLSCIYWICTCWIFGHHASRCVIDGLGSDYASPLMFWDDMEWHSAYMPLGDPHFSLFCALLQLGVPAHQWPTVHHPWPVVPHPWPVAHHPWPAGGRQ